MFLSTAPSLPSSLYISSSCSPLCFFFFFFALCLIYCSFSYSDGIPTSAFSLYSCLPLCIFFSFNVFALWSPFYLEKKRNKPCLLSFSRPPTPIMFSFSSLPLISPTSPPFKSFSPFLLLLSTFFLLVYILSQSRPFPLPPVLPSSPFATADQGKIYIQHHGQLPMQRKHRAAVTPVGQR